MPISPANAQLPSFLPANSLAVAPGPPFAVGAHGQLHKGYLNGLQVAVKQLRSGAGDAQVAEELLLEEAALMQRLNHSAILHVFGCVRVPGKPLQMVMELCDDGSLFERIHRKPAPLPLELVLSIMKSVCSAVAYAHDFSIIHRDIKPGNVLLTSTGAVKLCDFGLSRRLADSSAPMTQGIGTPQYMAPELLQGASTYDSKVDVWSLGMLLYEMVSRKIPYDGMSPVAAAVAVVSQRILPPLSGSVPDWVRACCSHCWAFDAQRRPTARELLVFLNGITLHTSIAANEQESTLPISTVTARRRVVADKPPGSADAQ